MDKKVSEQIREQENEVRFHCGINKKQLGEYEFSQVLFISEMLDKRKAEEAKEKYRVVAFGEYLKHLDIKMSGGFNEYLDKLGLGESEKTSKETLKKEIAHAKEVIAKMDLMRNRN